MSLRFFDVHSASDLPIQWPDVYFGPAYGRGAAAMERGAWELAMWGDGEILYPYVKRPIAGHEGLFDVVSPYGYSGIWGADGVPRASWRRFRTAVRDALQSRGCVAEFLRIGTLLDGLDALTDAAPEFTLRRHVDTIGVDVSAGYDAAWSAYESRGRRATKKGRRNGLVASTRPFGDSDAMAGSAFRRQYDEVMDRVRARDYYRIVDESWSAWVDVDSHLIEVRDDDGALAASVLLMGSRGFVHAHLGGTDRDAQRLGAGNVLYDAMVRHAADRGGRLLHVGGSHAEGDGLHLFKRSFGRLRFAFYTASSVLQHQRYRQITARRAATCGRTSGDLEATGYFPAYRAA